GIRDFHVTGVQTCALPISPGQTNGYGGLLLSQARQSSALPPTCVTWWQAHRHAVSMSASLSHPTPSQFVCLPDLHSGLISVMIEIGRASCRGRREGPGSVV